MGMTATPGEVMSSMTAIRVRTPLTINLVPAPRAI